MKILPPKNENFQIKNSDSFHIFAQNIHCGYSLEPPRRDGSNEHPQSMFWSRNKTITYTPVNPRFTIQKWDLRGSKLYRHVFVMVKILIRQCCSDISHNQWLLWIFRELFAEGLRGSRGPMKRLGQSHVGSSVHLGLL